MSRNYKFYNPVDEGLLSRPEDYVYSSARGCSGEKRLLNVVVIK